MVTVAVAVAMDLAVAADSAAEAMRLGVAADLAALGTVPTAVVAVLAVQAAGSMGQAVDLTAEAAGSLAQVVDTTGAAMDTGATATMAEAMAIGTSMAIGIVAIGTMANGIMLIGTTMAIGTTMGTTGIITMDGTVDGGTHGSPVLVGGIHGTTGIRITGIRTTAPIIMGMDTRLGVTTVAIIAARTMEIVMPTVHE